MRVPFFDPSSSWRPPTVADFVPWGEAPRVAIDLETKDPQLKELGPGVRRGGYLVGVAFAIQGGPCRYLPVAHEGGDNLGSVAVLSYLKGQAAAFRGDVVGANLQYDLDYLAEVGVIFPKAAFVRDVQVAGPLLDEHRYSYALDALAKAEGLGGKDEAALRRAACAWALDPKKELWRLPARHVGAYAERDARVSLDLIIRQEARIDEERLRTVYDMESKLLPVLLGMRRRGVRFDPDRLDKFEAWVREEEETALEELRSITGVALSSEDVWVADAVDKALRPAIGSLGTTSTGKPMLQAGALLATDHPAARAMVRARKMNKARTTFVKSIRSHAIGDRIHCCFNQLRTSRDEGQKDEEKGAKYGRLSSVKPNLQQQPSPDRDPELAKPWRSIFVPEPGCLWACLDMSSQEPRFTVHFAGRAALPGAAEAVAAYRAQPRLKLYEEIAGRLGIEKKLAKIIFLGICYGMGQVKMCRHLGLSTTWARTDYSPDEDVEVAGPEGKAIMADFHLRVPYVRKLANVYKSEAKERGYVRTILGRKCRFPFEDGERQWTHKALNRVIQGSAADQVKRGMVDAAAAGFDLGIQVHDELDLSVPDLSRAEELASVMCAAVKLRVPAVVDLEIGDSWGTLAKQER